MKGRCFPKIYFSRIKKCIAFLVFAFFSINLYSATCTWTGAEDTDWTKTGNWEDGSAPTQNDDVVFSATVTNVPEFTSVTGDIEVGSFDTTNLSGGLDFSNHKFIIHGTLNKTVDFANVETLKVFGDYTDTSTSTTDINLILDFSENDEITVDLGSANFSSIVVENAASGKVLKLQGEVIKIFQMVDSGGATINFMGNTTISEKFSISGSRTENLIVSGSGTINLSSSTATVAEYLKFSNASGPKISGTELIIKNSVDENDKTLNFPDNIIYLGDNDTYTWIGEGSDKSWDTSGNLKPAPDSTVDWTNGSVNVIIEKVNNTHAAPTLPGSASFSSFIVKNTLGSDNVSVNVSALTVAESFKNSGTIKVLDNATIDLQGTVENAGTFEIDGSATFTFDSSETKKIPEIIFSGTGTINLSSDLYISKITIASDSAITFVAGSAKIFTDEFINKGTLTVESGAEIYADSFSSTGTTTFGGTLYTTNFSDETTNNSTYEKVFLGNYGSDNSKVQGNDSANRAKISELKTTDESVSKLPDSVEFIGGISVDEIYIEGTENKIIELSGSGKIYVPSAYNQISAAYARFQSSDSPKLVNVSTGTSDGISGIAKKSTAPNSEFPAGWEIQKYKWIGTNSSDWNTAGNWEAGEVGEVPDEFSIIIIPDVSALPFYPIISESNFEIAGKSLEIQTGGKLEITENGTLNISEITNAGEINLSGETNFTGTFENETDGVVKISADAAASFSHKFINGGQIEGGGTADFNGEFENAGTVSVQNIFVAGNFSDTGSWDNDEITITFDGTSAQTANFNSTKYNSIVVKNSALTFDSSSSDLKCKLLEIVEGVGFSSSKSIETDSLINLGTLAITNGDLTFGSYKGEGTLKISGTLKLSNDTQLKIKNLCLLGDDAKIEDDSAITNDYSIEIENIDYNSHDIEIKTHRPTKIPGGTGAKNFTVTSGEVEITSDINLSGNLTVASGGKIRTEKITVAGNFKDESSGSNASSYKEVLINLFGVTNSEIEGENCTITKLKITSSGSGNLIEFKNDLTLKEFLMFGERDNKLTSKGDGVTIYLPDGTTTTPSAPTAQFINFDATSNGPKLAPQTPASKGILCYAVTYEGELPAGWASTNYEWTGEKSDNKWENPENWKSKRCPDKYAEKILIPEGCTTYPEITSDTFNAINLSEFSRTELKIENGAKLKISTDCTLSIVDAINSGEIEISAGKTTFTGTFENETDGEISGAGSIRFKGDFTNTGSVSIINLEIEKDFSDTGSWDNDEITIKFNGTNEQTATFGSTTEIGTGTDINYPQIIIDNDVTTSSELKCAKLTVNEGKTFTGAGIKISETLTNDGTIELGTGTFYVPNYKGKGAIKTGGTIHLSDDTQLKIINLWLLGDDAKIEDDSASTNDYSIEIENIDYNSHSLEIKTHRPTKIPGGTGAKNFTVTSGEVEITSDINLSGDLKVTSDSGTAGKISTETKITVGGNLTVESDAEISTNAEIEAGGDLTVASGGKIISTDSEITVGGNLEVASGGQITTRKITVSKNFKDESSGTDASSYGEVIINLSGGTVTNSEIETASADIIETLKITSRGSENSIEFKSNLTLQEFLMVGESDNKLTSKGDDVTITLPVSYNEKVAARFVHFDFGPKLSFVDSSGDEYCFAQSCTSSTDGTNPGEYKYPDRWEGLDGERWTGNKDEKWNDDENWVGFVPVDGIKVTIPNGCANYPDAKLESALSLAKLTIESGASINLCSGTLSLISTGSDDVLVNDGTFTISGDGVLKISKWTPASSGSDFKLKENATFEYVGSVNVELKVEVETTNDEMVTIKNGDASATLTVDFTTSSNPNVKFDGEKIETATENFGAIQNDATLTLNATSSLKVNGKLENNGELKLENDLTISGDFENNGKLQSTGDLTISGETTNASTATLEIENLTLKNSLENSRTITAKKVFFDISSDINLYSGSSDSNKFPPVEFSGTARTVTLKDDLYSEEIKIENGVTFSAEQDKNIFTKDFINLGKVSIEGKLSTVTLTDETTNGSTYSEVALWNYGDINAFITGVTGDGTENCLAISKLTTDTSSLPKSVKIVGAISVTEIFIQGESISNKIELKNSGTIYVPAKYTKISAQYVKFEGSDFPVLRDKENPTSSENILGIPFECESDASGNYPDGWHLGFIWNGKTNIEWHEDSNWENGAYPRASNSLNALIIIPKVDAGNYPEISASTNLPLLSSVEIYVREEASLSVTSQIEFRDSLISNDGDINLSENCAISKTASGSGVLKNSGNINLSSSSTVLDLQAEAENSGEIKVGEGTLKFISFDSNAVGKIFVQGGGVKYSGSDSYTLPENTTLSISPSDVATKIYGVSDSSLQKTFEISNMIFDGTGNFDLQTFGNVIINSALGNKIGELVVSPDSVENAGELILKKSGTVKKLLVKENALIKTETDSDFVVTEELLNNGKADFSKITIYKDVTNTNENDDAFKSTDFYISGTDVSVITGVFKFTNLKIENDSLSEIKVVKFPASDRINLPGIQVSGNFSVLGAQLSSGEKNIFLTAQGSPSEDDTTWWYLESASRVNVLDAKIGYAYSKYNIARFVVNCEELVDAVTSVELTRNWFMKIIPSTIHIKMSLSPIGQNKLFVMFDEPIETEKLSHIDEFGNDYYLNAMEDYPNAFGIYELQNGQGLPASEVDIKVDSDVPAKLVFTNEKSTGLELTLTREVTFDDIKNFYVVIKTGYEKYLQPLSAHALSDFAINLLNPLYIYDDEVMKSGVSETSDRPSGVAREWDEEQRNFGTVLFDEGNLHLIASVNDDAKISAADKFMVRAFFDNSPDSGAVSKNLENILSKSFRVWLPEISGVSPFKPISEKLNSNFKSTDGILLNSKNIYDGFDFTVSKGFEWKSGNQVSFLFGVLDEFGEMVKIDSEPEYDEDSEIYTIVQDFPIFALRLKNNSDITSLDLWSFKLQQAMYQRGGVTILSNVVNPLKGGKTTIKIENPSSARVDVIVMTLDGNIVTYLNRGNLPAGTQTFTWDGRNQNGKPVARGIYFVRILGNGFDETRKVMIVK